MDNYMLFVMFFLAAVCWISWQHLILITRLELNWWSGAIWLLLTIVLFILGYQIY